MELYQTNQFRKDELKRVFSYLCAHREKLDEILNPQDTLVIKGHISRTLHSLLENEFYQLALVMLYQCYYNLGMPEVSEAWSELIDLHISEYSLLDFFDRVLCKTREKEGEKLKR